MLDFFFFFSVVSIACEEDDDDDASEALILALAAVRSPVVPVCFGQLHRRHSRAWPDRSYSASNREGTHSCPG